MQTRFMTVAAQPVFVVLWSSAFIAGIVGVGAAPPMLVLFGRYAIAGVLLTGYAVMVRVTWPRGRRLRHVAVAGLLMQMVQFGAFYTAMGNHVPAAVIALVQGLNPVVIALFAGVLGETVTARQWFGFGIGGVGVALAVFDQSNFSLIGLVLCLIGLLGLSIGTVYQKHYVPDVDPRASTAVHVVVSAPIAGALALATGQTHVSDVTRFAGSLTWMVLVNSIAAFLLLNMMLRQWDATRVGKLFFATPVVTAILAWVLIGQSVGVLTVVGLAIGLIGLVFAARKPSSPAVTAPQPALAVR
ncbi:DMT family transporter [Nocardia sp. NPDC049149]|uniref:DMT family transporter n=1 Tax=Nocardia sp. NPDC049149 TaxID=3364315 RepID=UPI0037199031